MQTREQRQFMSVLDYGAIVCIALILLYATSSLYPILLALATPLYLILFLVFAYRLLNA